MAKLIVEIKSKEMIKPCSPTPDHLKTLQLSLADQFVPPIHTPFIFFYETPITQHAAADDDLLKSSLSTSLVQFYPLAGRIGSNSWINCNDEGVEYCVADVLTTLAEVIENPNPEELLRLLAVGPVSGNNSIVAAVQVNRFQCGGMAISVSISHKIADAATFVAFVNTWATNTVNVSESHKVSQLKFESASLFPQINLDGIYDPESLICKERIVTRRLIFYKDTIDRLRERAVEGTQVKAATRVQLVSAFLWKTFIDIAKAKPTTPKISAASVVVNFRTINMSPFPADCNGNLIWSAVAHTLIETEAKYPEAVDKLRTAVKQVDRTFLQKLQTGESLPELMTANDSLSNGEVDLCHFSSCVRFPLYEANFGWGTPVWVSMTTLPFKNSVFLLSTKCGQGIEGWVHVLEHDAVAFNQNVVGDISF